MSDKKVGVIIGAGPAGLSAAETLSKSDRRFTVLEATDHTGGISATIRHNDFLFDLGGHRFFTKNREIDAYVSNLLGAEQVSVDRSSKILLNGRLFDYPLRPTNAIFGLGPLTATEIIFNYMLERFKFNRTAPRSLEDWVISQFGKTLYLLFFKTYTEKVWGIPCSRISAELGVQRIKGLSLRTALIDAFWKKRKKDAASLVKHFTYPKKGIGVICEKLAETIREPNALLFNAPVNGLFHDGSVIKAVAYGGKEGGGRIETDFVIASMPITELILSLRPLPPSDIVEAARWLKYRDLVCVALMFNMPFVTDQTWIYVHDPAIDFGRLHEPKNWSRYMAPPDKSCVVFEYFCNEGDVIWNAPDADLF